VKNFLIFFLLILIHIFTEDWVVTRSISIYTDITDISWKCGVMKKKIYMQVDQKCVF